MDNHVCTHSDRDHAARVARVAEEYHLQRRDQPRTGQGDRDRTNHNSCTCPSARTIRLSVQRAPAGEHERSNHAQTPGGGNATAPVVHTTQALRSKTSQPFGLLEAPQSRRFPIYIAAVPTYITGTVAGPLSLYGTQHAQAKPTLAKNTLAPPCYKHHTHALTGGVDVTPCTVTDAYSRAIIS